MASPSENLARSLEALQALQESHSHGIIKANELSRTHKERLVANGFIQEVIKGWYIATRPDASPGDSTVWYSSFWDFARVYLTARFGDTWCLGPDQSLLLHAGNRAIPRQLLIRAPGARNRATELVFDTSFLDIQAALPSDAERTTIDGLYVFSLESGLIAGSPDFYARHPMDARTCLAMIREPSHLLAMLLDGGRSTIAGRLAGAMRNIGRADSAHEIAAGMKSAGYSVRETDPFEDTHGPTIVSGTPSPSALRIRAMWAHMRQTVVDTFPHTPASTQTVDDYLTMVDETYAEDAYHSLSIEGYRVTPELIGKVLKGDWNPDESSEDAEHRNALAARGHYQAFQEVKNSIRSTFGGRNAGEAARDGHAAWCRELFAPSVTAGIIKASNLAGYRNGPVYIKRSMHTPPRHEAVRDAMQAFFDLLAAEKAPGVRAVLGHFVFVYIHPYFDGNGRIGRFLMNTMLASGGYRWTIIPVSRRDEYMQALEKASVGGSIEDFSTFLGGLVKENQQSGTMERS